MGGGAAIIPRSQYEISSLRAEHGGVVGILLILYTIQIYMGKGVNPANHTVNIWIDNAEVLARGVSRHVAIPSKREWC